MEYNITHRVAAALGAVAVAVTTFGVGAVSVSAHSQGFIEDEFEYLFFYGTFDESPNVALFAGGPIEDFCVEDPGTATQRVFMRDDGTVDVKVNDKDQPIYLYETEFNDIPVWLDALCPGIVGGVAPPEPFAKGDADLKVRITVVSDDLLKIFNSVNGKAIGTDGTDYKVSGTADFVVEDGMLVGDPRDFVGFKLTEIRR